MTENQHLEDLKEIRSMMERSSRFISLSGLSGVFAGIYALVGTAVASSYISNHMFDDYISREESQRQWNEMLLFLFTNAAIVVILTIVTAIFFTTKQAKKKGQKIWDNTSKRLLINFAVPLVTGGIFCLILLLHNILILIVPTTLIFYGLSLINASKYTLNDIRYLGICEVALGLLSGLISVVDPGSAFLCWPIGFGLLHIVYGAVMYFKYER